MAETIQQYQNRAMETGALWKPGKTKVPFFPVPTALGKLDQERQVSHSSHSPYGWYK